MGFLRFIQKESKACDQSVKQLDTDQEARSESKLFAKFISR